MIKLCGENKMELWLRVYHICFKQMYVSYQIAVFFILSDPINNDVKALFNMSIFNVKGDLKCEGQLCWISKDWTESTGAPTLEQAPEKVILEQRKI